MDEPERKSAVSAETYLKPAEVTERLQCSERQVYGLIEMRRMPKTCSEGSTGTGTGNGGTTGR